jgi:hypothetical protein
MAWGSILGSLGSAIGGDNPLFQLGGQLFDLWETESNYQEGLGKNAQYEALINQAIANQMRAAGYDEALRKDLIGRTNEYEAALRAAFERLGPRDIITNEELMADYNDAFGQRMNDLNLLADRVSSTATAGEMVRGMDASMRMPERLAEIFKAQIAPAYDQARRDAFDEAIGRATGWNDLQTRNRGDILGEYGTVMGDPIDRLRSLLGQGGSSGWSSLTTQIGGAQDALNLGGLAEGRGEAMQGVDQKIQGIFDWFKNSGSAKGPDFNPNANKKVI